MARLNAQRAIFNWHQGTRIASCCRLTSSISDLKKYAKVDSFGNGGASLGSHRVVTLNLHRAALLSAGEQNPVEAFKKNVRWMADAARDLLIAHKFNILEPAVEKGMIPSFKIGWADMSMFFSTIGYTGLYDAFNVIYPGGTLDEYRKFAGITLDFLDLLTTQYSLDSAGAAAFNVEEIPGEGACPLLAKKDRYMFPGKTSLAILSNQMLPLYEQFDMFDRLEVAGELMGKVSGGAILHLNLSSPMTPDASVALSRLMLEKYRITHWAANYGFTVCRKTGEVHTTVGIHKQCPVCGNAENISYITRVVGFNTEVKDWNLVRRTLDFPNRQWGDIDYILKGRD